MAGDCGAVRDAGLLEMRRTSAAIVSATGEWRNWQTRRIQVPVSARTWGFKSPLAHETVMSRGVATCPDVTWKAGQILRHKVGPDGGFTLGPVPPARTGPGGGRSGGRPFG